MLVKVVGFNLPTGRELNPRPVNRKSNALPLSHLAVFLLIIKIFVYYNIMADISAKTRLAVVQLWDTPNWKSPIFDFFLFYAQDAGEYDTSSVFTCRPTYTHKLT